MNTCQTKTVSGRPKKDQEALAYETKGEDCDGVESSVKIKQVITSFQDELPFMLNISNFSADSPLQRHKICKTRVCS